MSSAALVTITWLPVSPAPTETAPFAIHNVLVSVRVMELPVLPKPAPTFMPALWTKPPFFTVTLLFGPKLPTVMLPFVQINWDPVPSTIKTLLKLVVDWVPRRVNVPALTTSPPLLMISELPASLPLPSARKFDCFHSEPGPVTTAMLLLSARAPAPIRPEVLMTTPPAETVKLLYGPALPINISPPTFHWEPAPVTMAVLPLLNALLRLK